MKTDHRNQRQTHQSQLQSNIRTNAKDFIPHHTQVWSRIWEAMRSPTSLILEPQLNPVVVVVTPGETPRKDSSGTMGMAVVLGTGGPPMLVARVAACWARCGAFSMTGNERLCPQIGCISLGQTTFCDKDVGPLQTKINVFDVWHPQLFRKLVLDTPALNARNSPGFKPRLLCFPEVLLQSLHACLVCVHAGPWYTYALTR